MRALIKQIKNKFQSASNTELLISILISTLLPLFVIVRLHPRLSEAIPAYSDFIAGATAWDGYNKHGDVILLIVYMVLYAALMFITPLVLTSISKRINPAATPTDPAETPAKPGIKNSAALFLLSFVVFSAVYFLINKIFPHLLVLVSFSLIYYILKARKVENINQIFTKFCLINIFGYVCIIAGSITISFMLDFTPYDLLFRDVYHKYYAYIFAAYAILFFGFVYIYAKGSSAYAKDSSSPAEDSAPVKDSSALATDSTSAKKKISDKTVNSILTLFQIPIPALFLVFYQFKYSYQGRIVSIASSDLLRNILIAIAVALILFNIYTYYRQSVNRPISKRKILLTTAVSLVALIAYDVQPYQLIHDYFHNGEYTVPVQQLFQYGSLPYFDHTPMHGLLNYAFNAFSFVFFNGEYTSFLASATIYFIIISIILCLIITRYTKGEVFPLILSIFAALIFGYDNRFPAVFIMLIVLHNKSGEDNPLKLLWWWVLTSILAIAWYPPLGVAAAASFIPVVIYSFIRNKSTGYLSGMFRSKTTTVKTLLTWAVLGVIGIMFLPMFIEIVKHTLMNMGSNLDAYAVSSIEAIELDAMRIFGNPILDATITLILRAFGFTAITGFLLLLAAKSESEDMRKKSFLMMIQLFLLVILMSNYLYGRSLGRTMAANTAFFAATAVLIGGYLFKNASKSKFYTGAAITIAVFLAFTVGGTYGNLFSKHALIWYRPLIGHESFELDGKAAGIPNLGTYYASQLEVNALTDISYVLEGEDSFLNLTNYAAYHSIFGRKVVEPFHSIYNTIGEPMHNKYLETIKENPPDVALVYPSVEWDGGPLSLRAYPIYRWLLLEGYRPYKHNTIVFLLSERAAGQTKYERADDDFRLLMRKPNLRYLPIYWGGKELVENRVEGTGIYPRKVGTFNIEENGGLSVITKPGSYIEYKLDYPISGIENDFIRLDLASPHNFRHVEDFIIAWASEGEPFLEDDEFLFKGSNGTLLIPMASSPTWALSENISAIRLHLPNAMVGLQPPDITIELYRYRD